MTTTSACCRAAAKDSPSAGRPAQGLQSRRERRGGPRLPHVLYCPAPRGAVAELPAVPPDDVEGRSAIGTGTTLERLLRPLFPRLVQVKQNQDEGPQRYDRYGFRVPAVIVSPYARPDYVCSEVLDHTSLLRLLEEKWNLPALTARDAAASTPLDALDFISEPAFLNPPSLPEPTLEWGTW